MEECVSDKEVQYQKALRLQISGKTDEAVAVYYDLLSRYPTDPAIWAALGVGLRQSQKLPAAAAALARAIELRPQSADFLMNYGNVMVVMDRLEEAVSTLKAAVELAPQAPHIRRALGFATLAAGECQKAIDEFSDVLGLQPDDIEARWGRTVSLLTSGRLTEGWKDFELRWQREGRTRPSLPFPAWNGEDLAGRTILLQEEQGFGDTILFSRYISLVKRRGAKTILSCRQPLHRLLGAIPELDHITERDLSEKADYCVPLLSLPKLFNTAIDTIPVPSRLHPAPGSPELQRLLELHEERFRVGIVWSGNVGFRQNFKRAAPLQNFLRLAEIPSVQLYSLQKGPPERDVPNAGAQGLVVELSPHLCDFADTAAAIKQLDLVIMTDSAVAHLAGSLDRPIWNLLTYSPYWIYMRNRQDTPWYPSMRLFRQPRAGDWDSVFETVASELSNAVALKREGRWPKAIFAGSSTRFSE